MKETKNKNVRKKYLVGTTIKNIIEDPSTALAQNNIDIANAQYAGETNPWVLGLDALGNMGMQVGSAMGGFSGIKGINPNLAKGLNGVLPVLSKGTQYLKTGGRVNSNIPVEVEGGEAGELPNGQLLDFNGPSHNEGGIPIDLPEGTEIYSKRIKIDGESMAERKLKRESILARYTKKAKKTGDAISSNTLKRVKKSVDIQEEEDKKVQQLIHDMTIGVVNAGNQVMREQHGDGLPVGDTATEMEMLKRKSDYDSLNDLYNMEGEVAPNLMLPTNPLYKETGAVSANYPFMTTNPGSTKPLATPSLYKATETIKAPTAFPTKLPTPTPMSPDTNVYGGEDVESKLPFITGGDALNIAGNIFSGVAPYLNTLQNRATDTPNVNSFKNYGEEGIDKMAQAENYLKQTFDSRLKEIGLKRSDAIKRGRNSSGSVNLMRALDTNADMAGNDAENKAYNDYASQMVNILSREAQLENEQDRMVMEGEFKRDLADREDKDNFYSAKGQGLKDLGVTVANAGRQVNEALTRETTFNLLDGMYENMGITPTGEIYGKVSKALKVPEGTVLKPNEIQDAISNGTFKKLGLIGINTIQDYYKKFGIPDPNPTNNYTQTATKATATKTTK